MSRLTVQSLVVILALVTFSVAAASSKNPHAKPPTPSVSNTSPPSISGTAVVGSTLQASSGSWSGQSLSYRFQWQRCDSSGANCAAISGATGSSYLVASADAGNTLRVSVTAYNRQGSATATSAPSSVGPTNYTNTALPAISGTPQVGETLTVSDNGKWSPTSSSFQYAWQRCSGSSCTRVSTDATADTYVIQSGDVGSALEVQVAPAGDFNDSVDSNPTAIVTNGSGSTQPPPPPSPPSGSVLFDGSAKLLTSLTGGSAQGGTSNPVLWTCLCFMNNDITLTPDSTYGKAYKTTVKIGDNNGYGGTPPIDGAGQLTVRQNNDLGKWDYYAAAVKLPPWSGNTAAFEWADILSLGYQTSSSDQVALGVIGDGKGGLEFQMQQNSGLAFTTSSGWVQGSVSYRTPFMPVTYDQWQDFVIGVNWATDNTGAVEVYSRTPGGSWSKVFERTNEPTYLYGTTNYGTFAQNGSNWPTVIDKLGLYFGEFSTSTPTETVYESGLTRSSDLATAESTLP